MSVLDYFDAIKNSTYGIIILGAIGSLIASAVAFLVNAVFALYKSFDKATSWKFERMGQAATKRVPEHTLYFTFVACHLSKIAIQCTACVICILVAITVAFSHVEPAYYTLSVTFLSFGILLLLRAYSNYRLNVKSWGYLCQT